MGGKTKEFDYKEFSANQVWQACVQTVATLGYTVISSDPNSHQISFNTGRSMSSWAGQDLSATVIVDGSGARLIMGGSVASKGNPWGGGGQLFSWGEKGKLIDQFNAHVRKIVGTIPEKQNNPSESSESVTDSIKKLAVLHDEGILTEDEYQSKKQELLDRM